MESYLFKLNKPLLFGLASFSFLAGLNCAAILVARFVFPDGSLARFYNFHPDEAFTTWVMLALGGFILTVAALCIFHTISRVDNSVELNAHEIVINDIFKKQDILPLSRIVQLSYIMKSSKVVNFLIWFALKQEVQSKKDMKYYDVTVRLSTSKAEFESFMREYDKHINNGVQTLKTETVNQVGT